MFRFELGLKVKDKLTGFTGFITGRAEFSLRPVSYLITKRNTEGENNYPSEGWFFESALIPMEEHTE